MIQVSVIIPTYNGEKYLEEALLSVFSQTYTHYEVIVVDDGSSDATARLAGEAGAVVVRHSRNRGKAAAMATGASSVAGLDLRNPSLSGRARGLLFVDDHNHDGILR